MFILVKKKKRLCVHGLVCICMCVGNLGGADTWRDIWTFMARPDKTILLPVIV